MKWLVVMVFVCGCSMMIQPKEEDAGSDDSVTGSDVVSDSSNDSGDSQTTGNNKQTESESGDTQIGSDSGTGSVEAGTGTEEVGTESVPNCKAGEVKCANSTTVLSCVSDQWIVTDTCSGVDTCVDGKCGCNPSPTGGRYCEDNKLYSGMTCGPGTLIEDCGYDGNVCIKQGINGCFYDASVDLYKDCKLNLDAVDRIKCYTDSNNKQWAYGYRRGVGNAWIVSRTLECPYGCNQIDLCTAQCY